MRYGISLKIHQSSSAFSVLCALFPLCNAGPTIFLAVLSKLELRFSCQILGCRSSLIGNTRGYTRFISDTLLLSCISEKAGLVTSHNVVKCLWMLSLACSVSIWFICREWVQNLGKEISILRRVSPFNMQEELVLMLWKARKIVQIKEKIRFRLKKEVESACFQLMSII